jgi:beta-lactamase regulating signal transducer with metallopeptidase domain
MTPASITAVVQAMNGSLIALLVVKVTIILAAAFAVTRVMQRASAGVRHLVWLVALGTVLLVPALTAWAPLHVRVLPPAAPPPASTYASSAAGMPAPMEDAPTRTQRIMRGTTRIVVPPDEPSRPGNVVARTAAAVRGMSALAMLLALWAAVALAIGASLAWSARTVRRIVNGGSLLSEQAWLAPLYEVSDRLGLDEPPRLLRTEQAKMPFACGLTHPTIVLPAECDGWSLERRRAVLLHELAHVRRRDLVGHTLGRLACAAYWFHPLVWSAARRLRTESERACDDLALACGTRATDYAEHLLDIVTAVRSDRTPALALAMARRTEFEGRMLAILDPELRRTAPSRRQGAALVATLALIALTVAAAAPAPRTARPAATAASAAIAARASARPIPALPASDAMNPIDAMDAMDAVARDTVPAAEPMPAPDWDRDPAAEVGPHVDAAVRAALREARRAEATAIAAAVPEVEVSVGRAAGAIAETTVASVLRGLSGMSVLREAGVIGRSDDERPAILAKVLRSDPSAELRRVAAWGLQGYPHSPPAGAALAAAVAGDASPAVREMAAWSLANGCDCGEARTTALSAALRGDTDPRVRATAAWALGSGRRVSPDVLVPGLTDANPEVRARAAWALGSVRARSAPPALVAMLGDRDQRLRRVAAWALSQIKDPAALPALEQALRSEKNEELQMDEIRAMGALGERSVDALRRLLESPDERVKTMAVHGLASGRVGEPWPWPWPEPRPSP